MAQGTQFKQGQVIGYVGTPGNAAANAPHLHFAIFVLDSDRRCWKGRPIDPYLVFTDSLGGTNLSQFPN